MNGVYIYIHYYISYNMDYSRLPWLVTFGNDIHVNMSNMLPMVNVLMCLCINCED